MNFEQFAESHGLIINSVVLDRWVRVPTTDHPHKKNGAYIWDGQSGAVQNWAIHEKPISFQSKEWKPDPLFAEKKAKAAKEKADKQAKAKGKAIKIMNSSKQLNHPYLERKGFPNDKADVWSDVLVIPMRIDQRLVGCQMISPDGTKKFLSGQITKGASLKIDNKGRDILCEGYATALSVRRVLKHLRKRYTIHVCFSAGNMLEIAKGKHCPLVIADNDPVGLKTAQKIGQYWVSDVEGEDFNDAELRLGVEGIAQSLLDVL